MPTGKDILQICPSRGAQTMMKQKIAAAKSGLNLLKRKREALEIKIREIREDLHARRGLLDQMMQSAFLAMAKARFLGFDFQSIIISNSDHAAVILRIKFRYVIGVKLPYFEIVQSRHNTYALTGLARAGQQVLNMRRKFQDVLQYLAELASLEYASKVLKKSVLENNMRVNGLEYVLIPKFDNTLKFIVEALDEVEREDFNRIKMCKAKYQRNFKIN